MFKRIQWKLVLVYSLIIIFAMQFFAVFVTQSIEDYYVGSFSQNLESQGLLLISFLERYLGNPDEVRAIDSLIVEYDRFAGTAEIMVLDDFGRVISSTGQDSQLRGQKIIQDEINRALSGTRSEAIRLDPDTGERMYYLALPVSDGAKNKGVVYMMGSLEPIYNTLREIQLIFLAGALLVIALTVVLGFFLARSITVPVQEVTSKAGQIARGDFRQRISIYSQDEIGQLGEMFNYLSRQLEATLQEISSEKGKVDAILKNMTDGIIALGRNGEILHVNRTARKMLGVAGDAEITVELLEELIGPAGTPAVTELDRQESREILLPSSRQIIEAYYVPFHAHDEWAQFSGVLIVLHDVTKEREFTRMQQEFVANVSHELRTPLTTLKSYTETLLDGAMNEPQVCLSFLSTMEKETERMVRLVKDLLALSQLDSRQVGWHKAPAVLDDIIQEAVNEVTVEFREEPRQVLFEDRGKNITAFVDRDKIKQVFLNIIHNACKYTKPGGKITISLDSAEGEAVIKVADTGIGIPEEDRERVFERFYRVDKTRSREYGGTGLGLAIAREITAAHNGTIAMESELGRGTTVTVRIPLHAGGSEEEEPCGNE